MYKVGRLSVNIWTDFFCFANFLTTYVYIYQTTFYKYLSGLMFKKYEIKIDIIQQMVIHENR